MKTLFLLFFMCFFAYSSFAEGIIDLGEDGFVCPLNVAQIKQNYSEKIKSASALGSIKHDPIDIAYQSNLKKHIGPLRFSRISKTTFPAIPTGTKILVISVNDAQSMAIAPQISANYALAIDYASLQDIAEFQAKAGVKYPIQPATEDYINAFKINSYPALVTFKENEIEVQEGF